MTVDGDSTQSIYLSRLNYIIEIIYFSLVHDFEVVYLTGYENAYVYDAILVDDR